MALFVKHLAAVYCNLQGIDFSAMVELIHLVHRSYYSFLKVGGISATPENFLKIQHRVVALGMPHRRDKVNDRNTLTNNSSFNPPIFSSSSASMIVLLRS